MSILIKGMDMPKSCDDCLFRYVFVIGTKICRAQGLLLEDCKDTCPLVPVQKHGRLIDANALYAVMKKERDRISENYGDNDEYVQCLNKYAMSMVRSAPTIIPAEEEDHEHIN